MAFLKGLTYSELAEATSEKQRMVSHCRLDQQQYCDHSLGLNATTNRSTVFSVSNQAPAQKMRRELSQ